MVANTYIKQNAESQTWHQKMGVPMGGKCSSELANLYCYAIESSAIDTMLSKSLYNTYRFIDDMLGFQPVPWGRFDYRMEHARTNSSPTEAVFLGMKVNTWGLCEAQSAPQRCRVEMEAPEVHSVEQCPYEVHKGVPLQRAGHPSRGPYEHG